ncbi:hypothetical protein SEPCBS57363_006811, partial [Sporothrix epigloea]
PDQLTEASFGKYLCNKELILGRSWMDAYDARLEPANRRSWIGKWDLRVPVFGRKRPHQRTAQRVSAVRLNAEESEAEVLSFRVTLEDVERALRKQKTLEKLPQIEKQLPAELRDLFAAFDQKASRELPPHRPGIDHVTGYAR